MDDQKESGLKADGSTVFGRRLSPLGLVSQRSLSAAAQANSSPSTSGSMALGQGGRRVAA
jgi:hypothetical protein